MSAPAPAAALQLEALQLSYGDKHVVRGVSLQLETGRIGCLLGPSGCGKTSVLRCVAGFERPDGGRVHLSGRPVAGAGAWVAPEQRRVGMVFQEHALFPHLTALGNTAFGLTGSAQNRRNAALAMLETVGLGAVAEHFPHELSGGQQQRVALARALAPAPDIVLLDEPFASLDGGLRESLARDVAALLRERGATALLVTHDQQEAFAMADDVGVIDHGQLLQWSSPRDLYDSPASPAVAALVGEGALIDGVVEGDVVQTPLGRCGIDRAMPSGPVRVLLRPEQLSLVEIAAGVAASITARRFQGARERLTVRLAGDGRTLDVDVPRTVRIDGDIGDQVGVTLHTKRVAVFPPRP